MFFLCKTKIVLVLLLIPLPLYKSESGLIKLASQFSSEVYRKILEHRQYVAHWEPLCWQQQQQSMQLQAQQRHIQEHHTMVQ